MSDADLTSLIERVVAAGPVGVLLLEPVREADGSIVDFRFRYLNGEAERILGMTSADTVGRRLLERIPENAEAGLIDRYSEVFDTGESFIDTFEFRAEALSGWFEVQVQRVDGHVVIWFDDVTDGVALEAAERSARREVDDVLSRISDGVLGLDPEWRITFVNAEAVRLIGVPRDELVGQVVWDAFPATRNSEFEHHYRRAVETGRTVSFEAYYPAPLDSWFSIRAYPGPEGLTVFFQDAGSRRRLEERISQVERVESIATLAGGIAHDFNNLLMVVSGHTTMLLDELGDGHPARDDVEAIAAASERMAELTRQLVTFSRRQMVRPVTIDLNAVVERSLPAIAGVVGRSVAVEARMHPEPVLVDIDPEELERSLIHLATNAREAMPSGGLLVLETEVVDLPTVADGESSESRARFGVVTLSDDGVGMEPSVLARAVEPFFTTRGDGHGTGLGLSAVHGMARQAGGQLSLYSEPGVGTTARIYLPCSEADAPTADTRSKEVAAAPPGDPSTRVLVIDDNDSVRLLVERILVDRGYDVVATGSPDEALALVRDPSRPVAVVVTDVVMPGADGHELAARLRASAPDLRVLFISGFTDHEDILRGIPSDEVDFLAKPFTPTSLAAKVHDLLVRGA